uniref:Thiol:disulfide interchange protein n=1 Tax=Balbiania investiens TaxID=111861 RepID=A0A4D6BNK2_9FLOR|nr:Thiol:disulfide interchange protein [Balbiania investiens]QBX88533.1 Thiol:disulfide interchange protein [Balbiania investiens]
MMQISLLQIELSLYKIQEFLRNVLIHRTYDITLNSFIVVFIGGFFTSFNPCMLSSLPLTISSLNKQASVRWSKYLFLMGTITSLAFIGLLASMARETYWKLLSQIPILVPVLTIVLGLNLLNLLHFKLPILSVVIPEEIQMISFLEPYLYGLSVGFVISPCSTPILMTLIIWIATTQNIVIGLSLILLYAVGYLSPIILCMISLDSFRQAQYFYGIWDELILSGGFIMLSFGAFSFFHELLKIYSFSI